jgi:hypothetical protein
VKLTAERVEDPSVIIQPSACMLPACKLEVFIACANRLEAERLAQGVQQIVVRKVA